MRTFVNQARQGDVFLRRVDALPDGVRRQDPIEGKHVLSHSESGHPHTVVADDVVFYYTDDPFLAYIEVQRPTILWHEKDNDPHQHKPFEIPVGIFEVRRQVEGTPEGYRRVMD